MNNKATWSVATIIGVGAGVLLLACGSSGDGDGAKTSEGAWDCGAKESGRVVCTTAMRLSGDTSNSLDQYACQAGEKSARCPDARAVLEGAGVRTLLSDAVRASAFEKLPWACLTTGKFQVQCARDLALMSVKSDSSGSSGETGGEGGEGGESSEGGPIRGCAIADWEPYFATLASEVYKRAGFDIDFPRAIFDSRARLDELASGTASAIMNPGAPSCYIAEWELRAQAWLRAVGRGCVNLTAPILVWCQQAANYAPSTHECNSSGSWAD